jgi:hypothetical protein
MAVAVMLVVAAGGLVAHGLTRPKGPYVGPKIAAAKDPPVKPEPETEAPVPISKAAAQPPPASPLVVATPTPSLTDEVNEAIDRGTVYLRKHLEKMPNQANYMALLGLTLLECGVSAKDPAIEWLADALRAQSPATRQTYQQSLHVLFFDCLGMEKDKGRIRELAKILCQNQYDNGTWSYGGRPNPPPAPAPQRPPGKPPAGKPPLAPKPPAAPMHQVSGDHSNTQFAALALWVASRHGIYVAEHLAKADDHFRRIQNSDGSWGYRPQTAQHHDSMTCAALMSLAMGHAIHQKYPNLVVDVSLPARKTSMARGLAVLAKTVNRAPFPKGGNRLLGADSMGDLYFLWSLERMAMIYHCETIGGKQWYPWAARILVDSQHADGHWQDTFAAPVDTCFALLILKRSNRVPDLTTIIHRSVQQKTLPQFPTLVELPPTVEPPQMLPEKSPR